VFFRSCRPEVQCSLSPFLLEVFAYVLSVRVKKNPVCIDLGKSSRLESADIWFYRATLEDATTQLANVFTHVRNLTFDTYYKLPQVCYLTTPNL
jgi:hypothetical protein